MLCVKGEGTACSEIAQGILPDLVSRVAGGENEQGHPQQQQQAQEQQRSLKTNSALFTQFSEMTVAQPETASMQQHLTCARPLGCCQLLPVRC